MHCILINSFYYIHIYCICKQILSDIQYTIYVLFTPNSTETFYVIYLIRYLYYIIEMDIKSLSLSFYPIINISICYQIGLSSYIVPIGTVRQQQNWSSNNDVQINIKNVIYHLGRSQQHTLLRTCKDIFLRLIIMKFISFTPGLGQTSFLYIYLKRTKRNTQYIRRR